MVRPAAGSLVDAWLHSLHEPLPAVRMASISTCSACGTTTRMIVAIVVVAALSLVLAFSAGTRTSSGRDFFAAGGRLATPLYFLLALGETYSIGSLLGFPGGIVAKGSTLAFWFVGYILLAFPIGFVLYPRLWQVGTRSGAATIPDLFRHHFGSVKLERSVAILLVLILIPLGASQFIGLRHAAALLFPASPASEDFASVAVAFFVLTASGFAGLRAPARVSALKDILVLGAIASLAIAAIRAWPVHATMSMAQALAPHPTIHGDAFLLSTVVVQAIGFCLSPPTVAGVFAARSPEALRRAQWLMPLYMILFPLLMMIAGFATAHPPLATQPDAAFLATAGRLLPPWGFGLVIAGVGLSALVVLSGIALAIAALVARNLVPQLDDALQKTWGRVVMALYLAAASLAARPLDALLTQLNTLFYLGMAPLLPCLIAIATGYRTSARRAAISITTGLALGLLLRLADAPLGGINPALPALLLSAAVLMNSRRKQTSQ